MKSDFAALRVMIADNTPLMCELLRGVLLSVGIDKVKVVRSGEDALAALAKWPADILFLDWEMGLLSGIDVLKAIRASTEKVDRHTRVIMTTAHAEEKHVLAARDAGVHEYLVKPFTGKAVLARLAAVINDERPFVRREGYFGPELRAPAGRSRSTSRTPH